jgi:hypothetical protein
VLRRAGRFGVGVEWINDGGEDATWSPRDGRILAAWGAGILVFAVAAAAVVTALR